MIKAVFPGSFDPPTVGHLNIIERSCRIFDETAVVIASNPQKSSLFTVGERRAMMEALTAHLAGVTIHTWDRLIVDFVKEHGADVLVRGIRNTSDFAYEFDLSLMNRALNASIETLFLPTEPEYAIIKSSSIKELAQFGGDISRMVPPLVAEAVRRKLGGERPAR